jgi:hypothetical protein
MVLPTDLVLITTGTQKTHLAIDEGPIVVMIEKLQKRFNVEIIHEYP